MPLSPDKPTRFRLPHMAPGLILLSAVLLNACSVMVPTFQMVSAAKTGYDIHEIFLPKERMNPAPETPHRDDSLQLKIKRNLQRQGIDDNVTVYTLNGHVWLVGLFQEREQADPVLDIVRKERKADKITACFYLVDRNRPVNENQDRNMALALRRRILDQGPLPGAALRIHVLQQRALLMGQVPNDRQKARILATARQIPDILAVADYLEVR